MTAFPDEGKGKGEGDGEEEELRDNPTATKKVFFNNICIY